MSELKKWAKIECHFHDNNYTVIWNGVNFTFPFYAVYTYIQYMN